VFAANPQAFINGDMNLIKAGSWLEIPDLYQAIGQNVAPAAARAVADESATALAPVADAVESYEGPASRPIAGDNRFNSGFVEPVAPPVVAQPQSTAKAFDSAPAPSGTSAGPAVGPESSEVPPGEISLAVDSPFVSAIATDSSNSAASAPTVIIPDATIRHTAPVRATDRATSPSPAVQESSGPEGRSWSGLAWLGGAGVAVFLGLLLFGRQIREKFGSTPVGDAPAAYRNVAGPNRSAESPLRLTWISHLIASATCH
jgi:Tfp pilus assembly protein FimV